MKRMLFVTSLLFSALLFGTQISVIGEVFTQTWWPYCPDARAGLSQLEENHTNVIPLIWEGDGHTSPGYSQRGGMYGVGGIPHAEFNGTINSIGGGTNMYPYYLDIYDQLIDDDEKDNHESMFKFF